MTDGPGTPPDSANDPDLHAIGDAGIDAATTDDESRDSRSIRGLALFADVQRQVASIDFGALTAAQHLITPTTAFKIPAFLAAQDAIAKDFARSLNFAGLAATHKALLNSGALKAAATAQTEWAATLANSIDFSALKHAIGSLASLTMPPDTNRALADALKQTTAFASIAKNLRFEFPRIDIPNWVESLNSWIPVNLRDISDLDPVAAMALDDGIPVSWIPRHATVVALVGASDPAERPTILMAHREEILDDCEAILEENDNEWATQCRNAIAALRAGFGAPAQSHAGNIIDSIVLAFHGPKGRDEAKKSAEAEFDDLPLQLAAENLTLRPLLRAFTAWWPASGLALPDYFARHPTAHAVGNVGVFAPCSALVAVMLATSLTVQYSVRGAAAN